MLTLWTPPSFSHESPYIMSQVERLDWTEVNRMRLRKAFGAN